MWKGHRGLQRGSRGENFEPKRYNYFLISWVEAGVELTTILAASISFSALAASTYVIYRGRRRG